MKMLCTAVKGNFTTWERGDKRDLDIYFILE